jgi:formate hydrogenlyase subunit 3/multisubunit Na+/H+ antiporter MnhD subunit
MSDYKQIHYKKVAYKYYNNGVLGSVFFMLFTFVVYFTFNSSDITYISNNLEIVRNNYIYNASLFIFLLAIIFKFFSFNFYFSSISKSSEITNMLFINILFVDVILGVYLLRKFLYSMFDLNIIFNIFHFNYIFFLIGSILIIYSAYRLYERRNLMPNIYSFSLIILGYIVILLGINNEYSFVSTISFLINHILIDFLFYIVVALCLFLFKKSETPMLYVFNKYKYVIYSIVLSKMMLPIAFGFNSNWNFILAITKDKHYYLFAPFIIEKISMVLLFVRYYFVFCKETKEGIVAIPVNQKINIHTNFMLVILVMFFLIVVVSLSEGIIANVLFNFIG